MFFYHHKYFILLFGVILQLFVSLTSATNEEPVIVGVYNAPPTGRIMNYKGSNTLKCNITGTTKPEDYYVQWSRGSTEKLEPKDNDPHFEIKDNDLIIKAINDDILKDMFSCALYSKATKQVVSQANFNLIGKPTVKIVSQGTFIQGHKILLECQAQGYPKPHIEWRYENTTFVNRLGKFHLKDNLEKGLMNYYLQVDEAEMTDRGEYACRAYNDFTNSTEAIMYVRVKDKYAALWPFIGICAEVVVLCAIIFVYERKRNKAELDESDTDQSPEQKNTPDHGKESVRQRK
ncbi:immunoglobulin domain-containing protein Bsg [Rhodnius prolixus]|uniref:Ig-like domain-containing protein n=1 Tax=Rhodnius prolixus TaxID=13249 RepID=A0ABL0DGK8_RHOPR